MLRRTLCVASCVILLSKWVTLNAAPYICVYVYLHIFMLTYTAKVEKYIQLTLLRAVLFMTGVFFSPSRQFGQVGERRLLFYTCHVPVMLQLIKYSHAFSRSLSVVVFS